MLTLKKVLVVLPLCLATTTSSWAQLPGPRSSRGVSSPSQTAEAKSSDLKPGASDPKSTDDVRESIEFWEDRVRKNLGRIEQILNAEDFDFKKIANQKVAVDELRDLIDELEDEAITITDAHRNVQTDLEQYRNALAAAPESLRMMADEFKKGASKVKTLMLKESYADIAVEVESMATMYEKKAAEIGDLESEIEKKMAFVRESRQFISDVRILLSHIPVTYGIETERFVAQINKYTEVFEEAVKAIKGVAHKIGEEPKKASSSSSSKQNRGASIQGMQSQLQRIGR